MIDAAAAAGFDAVGIRVIPALPTDTDILANPALRSAIQQRLSSTNMRVLEIDVLRISPDLDVRALRPALQYAGDLGARQLTVTGTPRDGWAADHEIATARKLAELCEAASAYGVQPMIEFMAYRGIRTLHEALQMRKLANHPNLGICVDALHFHRTGGTAADLEAVDPAALSCFHLCDAPADPPEDLATEARYGRLYPGEGGLPLLDMLRALPNSLPVAVEAPDISQTARPVRDRSLDVMRCTRDVLTAAGRP